MSYISIAYNTIILAGLAVHIINKVTTHLVCMHAEHGSRHLISNAGCRTQRSNIIFYCISSDTKTF